MARLDDEILEFGNIAITGHVRPDGDCLGSCLGVKNYINNKFPEKKVTVYLEEIIDRLKFLPGAEAVDHDFNKQGLVKHDLIIVLDSSSIDRIGDSIDMFNEIPNKFSVDHHISNTHFVDNLVLGAQRSSTCEIVYELMDPEYVDYNTAMCLYTGIVTDTGVFKYAATSKETMKIAGELMERKIPFQNIIDGAFYEKTRGQALITAAAMLDSKLCFNNRCAYSVVDRATMKKYGVTPKDMDGTIDELRLIKDVECAMLVYELKDGEFKVSLRAKNALNVSEIAKCFGGGGHIRAAGCSFEGDFDTNLNKILSMIQSGLKEIFPDEL